MADMMYFMYCVHVAYPWQPYILCMCIQINHHCIIRSIYDIMEPKVRVYTYVAAACNAAYCILSWGKVECGFFMTAVICRICSKQR